MNNGLLNILKMKNLTSFIILAYIFIPSIHLSQELKSIYNSIDSISKQGNSAIAKEIILKKIGNKNELPKLILARYYNLLGDIYYTESDIGKAMEYWTKSYYLIKNSYGENSIFIAENYSLFARYYNYRIMVDSAYYYSKKAIEICHKKKDSLHLIPVHKVYREYAFALKIQYEKENYLNSRTKARIYFDSANYYNELYFHDKLYRAQSFQDIGNTYTDATIFYSRISLFKNHKKAKESFLIANDCYNKALVIYNNAYGSKHTKIATLYLVKGLSYDYCFGSDSLISSLLYYQKGICALSPAYNNTNALAIPNLTFHFNNPALTLTLLSKKTEALYQLYKKSKDLIYLESCYNHSKIAVKLWENTFKNFKTQEIHQALEVYGASPFASIVNCSNEYYQLTKKTDVKESVFKWMDLNKYSVLLKDELQNNAITFKFNKLSVYDIQGRLSKREAIIEYYIINQEMSCAVITKNTFDLFPINRTYKINSKINELLLALEKHNAKDYCKTAKELYDTILNPYIKNLSNAINHLIIIPHDKLSQIPFDALIYNQTNNYSSADFVINHFNITYALSCNLMYNNIYNLINNKISVISPEYKQYSNLPFSKKVIDNLKSRFNLSNFNLSAKSKDNAILHVSAHAYCDYKNSRNSYILLSDLKKLFLHEISNNKLNYKLGILNACETANGDIEKGEGVINFSRHLYLAGIKSTITTLWKVDDEATAKTIEGFYYELENGNSSETSLYNSKLKYLNSVKSIDDYDPYYWSGLIYTGNDLKLDESKVNHISRYYILFGIIISLGLALLFRKFFF